MRRTRQKKTIRRSAEAGIQFMEKSSESKALKDTGKEGSQKKGAAFISEGALFLVTIVVSALAAYYYQKPQIEIAGIAILAGVGFGCTWFAMERSREDGTYLYDNEKHPGRFTVIYLFCLGASVLFPFLPTGGWPYLVVFVGLMLFGNQMIGFMAGSTLLMISILLQGGVTVSFFVYFISGSVGILVFSYVNEKFKIWLPLFISIQMQFVCLYIQ